MFSIIGVVCAPLTSGTLCRGVIARRGARRISARPKTDNPAPVAGHTITRCGTTATQTASPLPQRLSVADTRVGGSLASGHVPASTSPSAKTEVAEQKQNDHDESDEPNDSVHVRVPRS